MKLYNVTQIRAEDYEAEMQQTIEKLGNILNPFMQQVQELTDGRLDFENSVNTIKTVEITVDSSGVPILGNKVQTGKSSIRGFQVVNAVNLTNNAITATSQPFIAKYTSLGGGLVEINKITGLPENNNFRLTVVIY